MKARTSRRRRQLLFSDVTAELARLGETLEQVIFRDPGQRGLLSLAIQERCAGQLASAAAALALGKPAPIGILTGFPIRDAIPPAPETDGPPGAELLYEVLSERGDEVTILTEAEQLSLFHPKTRCLAMPAGADGLSACQEWVLENKPRAIVAIERVGPSHSAETVGVDDVDDFRSQVPRSRWGVSQSMRGVVLDDFIAPLHRVLELAPKECRTIGIGDGGNELGMGALPWSLIAEAIPSSAGAVCRVPVDHLIPCGVSNWGAQALALLVGVAIGRPVQTNTAREWQRLARMVAAGAIDGVTRENDLSVDGLPWAAHEAILIELLQSIDERP